MSKLTTQQLIDSIENAQVITEQQINLLKKRANAGDELACGINFLDEIYLTDDQFKKGIDWLKKLWKTPKTGVIKKNNPFGKREQYVIQCADYMTFEGWCPVTYGYDYVSYEPIYGVYIDSRNSFQYYVWGGNPVIIA